MRVLYFAQLRRVLDTAVEDVNPPAGIDTVDKLKVWLAAQSPRHATAFASGVRLCAAVNQDYAGMDHRVGPEDEVAFFPPVTGG
jgi:molybdopterin converting factor subunit 1